MASGGNDSVEFQRLINDIKKIFETESQQKNVSSLMIAAIDFGSTYSGYAYFLREKPEDICMGKFGESDRKAPTSLLLDSSRTFVAFGFRAETTYEQLVEDGKADDYYFFQRFKMKLYETKTLKRDTRIQDIKGKELEAIHVFTEVIKHLTKCVYDEIHRRIAGGCFEDDVLWILTVPAIWSDAAKQFMREAACQAGIANDNLRLILEPEAASLYCRSQRTCRVVKVDGNAQLESFPVGHRYIVADLGGGTADIAVHEILEDLNIKEVSRSDGEAFGGMQIDRAFMQFLEEVFGQEMMSRFYKDTESLISLRRSFEVKKREFNPNDDMWIRFKLNYELTGQFLHLERTENSALKEKIKVVGDKISIHPDLMKTFFQSALDGIIKFINKLRNNNDLGTINTVLLVGGLAESKYIQHVIENSIEGIRVIVPNDPSLAVLKGALLFGKDPKAITMRISRFSYGFSVARPFEQNSDPHNLQVTKNGRVLCKDVFQKLISIGESIEKGSLRASIVARESSVDNLLAMLLSIGMPLECEVYKSELKDPNYTTVEHGSECIGKLMMMPPDGRWPLVTLIVRGLVVGESELRAFAFNLESKEMYTARLDCL